MVDIYLFSISILGRNELIVYQQGWNSVNINRLSTTPSVIYLRNLRSEGLPHCRTRCLRPPLSTAPRLSVGGALVGAARGCRRPGPFTGARPGERRLEDKWPYFAAETPNDDDAHLGSGGARPGDRRRWPRRGERWLPQPPQPAAWCWEPPVR